MSDRLRILTVDDNDFDRELIYRALNKSGRTIDLKEAATPEQALEMLATYEFDCMLLDYLLPKCTGVEFLQGFDNDQEMPAVVMLTGMGDEKIAVEAMKAGANDYISKDEMNSENITAAIDQAIASRNGRIESLSRQNELEQMSFYDQLTGLANRNLLMNRLGDYINRSKRQQLRFSVMLMDLDGFKSVNDRHGHEYGDKLLSEVGARLTSLSRDSDTVARLGGDEFVLLLTDTQNTSGAVVVAQKIIDAISIPIDVNGTELQVSASIGIAMFPEHGDDVQSILKSADKAMYDAKRNQLGYKIFNDNNHHNKQLSIITDLPQIMTDDSMVMHFQPKVALESGDLAGAEVLIRWQHPEFGLLSPNEFITLAEKNLIIHDISFRLIDLAMEQYRNWLQDEIDTPLSLNLSSHLLSDYELATTIESIRRRYQIDANQITLEITESALITDPRRACKILEQLVADGFRISIDDFGTGYSSLSYLRDFPIQEIKIDKSFVKSVTDDVRNSYIIEAIVSLAKSFGTMTVAEGIETVELWNIMHRMGCDIGQGYFISKPVSAAEFAEWHRGWRKPEYIPDNMVNIRNA